MPETGRLLWSGVSAALLLAAIAGLCSPWPAIDTSQIAVRNDPPSQVVQPNLQQQLRDMYNRLIEYQVPPSHALMDLMLYRLVPDEEFLDLIDYIGPTSLRQYDVTGPLMARAVHTHREQIVRRFIEIGVPVDIRNREGRSPLMIAAASGQDTVVQLLVDAGADPFARDSNELTAAMMAYIYDYVAIGVYLDEITEDDSSGFRGVARLYMAAESGSESTVASLLEEEGILPDRPDAYGRFPVSAASRRGYASIIRLLIQHGADSNTECRRDYGRTPLMYAAENGDWETIHLLLEHSADACKQSYYGLSASASAYLYSHLDIGRFLDDICGTDSAKYRHGRSLFDAVWEQDLDRARFSLTQGTTPNVIVYGMTPLMAAAQKRNPELIALLVEYGADIHAVAPRFGRSPYEWLSRYSEDRLPADAWARILECRRAMGVDSK